MFCQIVLLVVVVVVGDYVVFVVVVVVVVKLTDFSTRLHLQLVEIFRISLCFSLVAAEGALLR